MEKFYSARIRGGGLITALSVVSKRINIDMASSAIEIVSKWSGTNRNVNGKPGLLNITAEVAVKNALTYSLYAESVRLGGCCMELFLNGSSNVSELTPAKLLQSRSIKPLPLRW